jgi:cardiolipin synthase A/B
VVVDGCEAVVGGINFADRYNDVDNIPAWLDFALHLYGTAALELHNYCASDWKLEPADILLPADVPENPGSIRIRRNDWVKGHHEVWKTYFHMFNSANRSITIMCSYFLPGRVLRNRLVKAAKRGVRVKLILAGPSDVVVAKYAERYLYSWMINNGIEIYEYQPTVLHAKMMVVDEHWLTIGSYNVNNVSAYASLELNLDVRNRPFAEKVQQMMDDVIDNDCVRVTKQNFISNQGFLEKFLQKSCYEFIRVILNLSTFYFRHE